MATPLCFHCNSIQFKVTLNTTSILHSVLKQLHVSIRWPNQPQVGITSKSAHYVVHCISGRGGGGPAAVQLVEALRYKPEGRGFDFRWRH